MKYFFQKNTNTIFSHKMNTSAIDIEPFLVAMSVIFLLYFQVYKSIIYSQKKKKISVNEESDVFVIISFQWLRVFAITDGAGLISRQ